MKQYFPVSTFLAFTLLLLILPLQSFAQIPTSSGTEFDVVFMENMGGGGPFEQSSLRLYLSGAVPAEVLLTDRSSGKTVTVSVPGSFATVEVSVDTLFGSAIELSAADIGISDKVLSVTADRAISLTGVSVRMFSADAFLCLSRNALGRRYVVLADQNGYLNTPTTGALHDMPSQFAVVASENNTRVTIIPSLQSKSVNGQAAGVPFSVTLQAGQLYLGHAQLGGPNDVTGTEIMSDKPVGVFAGCRRASNPKTIGNFRDFLVEQLIPVEFWQDTFLITPFPAVEPSIKYNSIVRIISGFDTTLVSITTATKREDHLLLSGDFLEYEVSEPLRITSTQPVMVAHYEHSVDTVINAVQVIRYGTGDPFMTLIPAPVQFQSAYTFSSVSHTEFTQHYATLILPAEKTSDIYLDSEPLPKTTKFEAIPGTEYVYANVKVSAGEHIAILNQQLDEYEVGFGLIVYGYGMANSYGYPGGMKFPKAPSSVEEERELFARASFTIVPQPIHGAKGELQLSLPTSMRLTFELYDTEGRLLRKLGEGVYCTEGGSQYQLDLEGVPSGGYFCRITGENGIAVEQSLIIQQ
ncbi:MAG: T9SS type A sorting domain-containing protein [Ignavibacteriae bacterium]|nr:T9SS type A sorting domain-containing protein [Ignavibacteriota bacterium]MCB9215875.1 T9SS type A sorting domain-containing protein [Ignavibacteria bacterium]